MITCSKDESSMRPASNYSVVLGRTSGGRPIFTLNMLFLSKTDSTISVIGTDAVFAIQLNGSGKAEIDMTLPNFAEEELEHLDHRWLNKGYNAVIFYRLVDKISSYRALKMSIERHVFQSYQPTWL